MRAKDAVGRYGEDVAARHLTDRGYELVARNWRCRAGEIDIIARHGRLLCFVEVKTRSSEAFGVPAEAVSRAKAQRLRVVAATWLAAVRPPYADLRFDVISVLRSPAGPATVEHLMGAF